MRKLIALLTVCSSVACGVPNYFTDVTIEGTPYITTSVLAELEQSSLSRGMSVIHSGPTINVGAGRDANKRVEFYTNITPVEEGDPANTLSAFAGSVVRGLMRMRALCSTVLWKNWINELPTPNGFQVDNFIDVVTYTNQVDYFIAAGLSPNGWRSAINYNPEVNNWRDFDDPMYIYRKNSLGEFENELFEGDILGPWIIDDLQLAFDHAKHQVPQFNIWKVSVAGLDTSPYWRGDTGTNRPSTYAQAESIAMANYAEQATPSIGNRFFRMYSQGNYVTQVFPNHYSSVFHGEVGYKINYGEIQTLSSMYFFGGEITAYVRATKFGFSVDVNTFDNNGFAFIIEDTYAKIDSITVASGTVTNELLAASAIADPSQMPVATTGVTQNNKTYRGFYVNNNDQKIIYSPNHPYTR